MATQQDGIFTSTVVVRAERVADSRGQYCAVREFQDLQGATQFARHADHAAELLSAVKAYLNMPQPDGTMDCAVKRRAIKHSLRQAIEDMDGMADFSLAALDA